MMTADVPLRRCAARLLSWAGAVLVLVILGGVLLIRSGASPLFQYLVDLSLTAKELRAPSREQTLLRTVAAVSRRYSDAKTYDASRYSSPLDWAYGRYASCDQQVAMSQRLLYELGIASESWALLGALDVSEHTVLVAFLDGRGVVVDPHLGWIFRAPSGRLATFEDIRAGRFTVEEIAPQDPRIRRPAPEELARMFAADHPPHLLGPRLSEVYSLRYKMLHRAAGFFALPASLLYTSHLGIDLPPAQRFGSENGTTGHPEAPAPTSQPSNECVRRQ